MSLGLALTPSATLHSCSPKHRAPSPHTHLHDKGKSLMSHPPLLLPCSQPLAPSQLACDKGHSGESSANYWHRCLSLVLLKCAGQSFLATGRLWSSGVGRLGGGPETNLLGFPSQPLSWGFQASRPPGLPSRMPFTLRTSSGSFWELTCSPPRHLLQAYSPCPTTPPRPRPLRPSRKPTAVNCPLPRLHHLQLPDPAVPPPLSVLTSLKDLISGSL